MHMYIDAGGPSKHEPAGEIEPALNIDCERALIFMLEQQDCKITMQEVGHYIRESLNLSIMEWVDVSQELHKRNVLSSIRPQSKFNRIGTVSLDLHALVGAVAIEAEQKLDYITPQIVHRARDLIETRTTPKSANDLVISER